MGLFNFKKKGKIIDLSRKFNEENKTTENKTGLAEFSEINNATQRVEDISKKRKKLAKRISDLIEKLDDLSNKIYHLGQRVEVLERKLRVNNFGGE
jgi:predicted nuclease with TOPRIM domain